MRRLVLFSVRVAIVPVFALFSVVSCTGDPALDPPLDSAATSTSAVRTTTTAEVVITSTLPPTTTTSTIPPPEPCVFSDPQFPEDDNAGGPTVESIQARGVVRVGVVPDDVAPFFYCDQGVQAGFEASLIRLLAEETFGDVGIEWVPLPLGDRITVVQDGGVDFAARFTTITAEREGQVAFTTPYLLDGPAVVAPANSGIEEVEDLDGLRIAIWEGTDLAAELSAALNAADVAFEPIPADAPEELAALVQSGGADAYGTSWTRAMRDVRDTGDVVVPVSFTSAMAVFASLDEPALSAALNASLVNLIDSGVWNSEFLRTLGVSPPWSTEQMAQSR